jgi:hypothetical protein
MAQAVEHRQLSSNPSIAEIIIRDNPIFSAL